MKILSLDIGGTSIKSALWVDGEIKDLKEMDTNAVLGAQAVMKRVIEIAKSYHGFERIGISTAGQVDPVQGIIRYANSNLPGYTGMEVRKIMEEAFLVPVVVENDVNCAAIGEANAGAGMEYDDFLCITYGTGVGGAIILEKKIYTGCGYSAGEFGSILVHADQRVPGDLLSGCYERYASTTALVKNAMLLDETLSDGRKIFARIQEPAVQQIVDAWIQEIAYGLTTLIHIFNPSCIVLGGGILEQGYILDKLQEFVQANIMDSFGDVRLKQAKLGNKAGLFGAAVCALERQH